MVEKQSVLGKGLASLLPGVKSEVYPIQNLDVPTASISAVSQPSGATAAGAPTTDAQANSQVSLQVSKDRLVGITVLDVSSISPNPHQPRREFSEKEIEELAQSIQANGIIQPLIVRKTDNGYELIAGERRLRAAKLSGLKQVPVVVRRTTDLESMELALIENIQREDLNCVDEALAYFRLMEEFHLTQEKISEQVGKERSTVANHLRLLKLPEAILEDLKNGRLTFGHGKVLASIEEREIRQKVYSQVIEHGLSVRETEALLSELREKLQEINAIGQKSETDIEDFNPVVSRLKNLSQELTRTVGAKVVIQGNDKKGKITFHYGTREELDRLLQSMQNEALWQNPQT